MAVSGTNFGRSAEDYGAYRAGFPDSFFDRIAAFNIGLAGQSVVDLGTGTGTLARGFALRGCTAVGIDLDSRMLVKARQLDRESGVSNRYVAARAESTGLDGGNADVVTAGQCWHWFDQPRVISEVIRLLKPGGQLVIANFDWLPLAGNVVEATETLIMQFNPDWHFAGGFGTYPEYLPLLSEAGIQNLESFSFDVDVPYAPEAWRGRIRASAGIAALDEDSGRRFDADLAELLATRFPASMLGVPHRVFSIVANTAN